MSATKHTRFLLIGLRSGECYNLPLSYRHKHMKMTLNILRHWVIVPIVLLVVILFPVRSFAQWTLLNSGTVESLNEIVFPAPDTGYVVGENGTLLRTFNGGDEWALLDVGTPKHLNDIFFLNAQSGFIVGDSGLFSFTYDTGEHWQTTYLLPKQSVDLSSVCFTSPLTGYVGGRSNINTGVILKTIDGGITWEETNTPDSFLDIQYKRIVFPTPDIGYALTRGMCMKTIDAGDHWFVTDTALASSGGMFSILEDAHFFSADTGYIVGWYNGFSGYTLNGGEAWMDQFISNNQWYGIDFPSREIGYLVGWGQFMKTVDGGQTWEDETSSLINSSSIYSLDFTDDHTGYACGAYGVILKTSSGGTTQTKEIGIASELMVYPNPTSGLFQIELNKEAGINDNLQSVMVYSSLGEKIIEVLYPPLPAMINLGDQPGGVYLIVVVTPQNQYATKVLLH